MSPFTQAHDNNYWGIKPFAIAALRRVQFRPVPTRSNRRLSVTGTRDLLLLVNAFF